MTRLGIWSTKAKSLPIPDAILHEKDRTQLIREAISIYLGLPEEENTVKLWVKSQYGGFFSHEVARWLTVISALLELKMTLV
ncbi:hypothetical protein LC593_25360 [Nostoc sp. CHAB 5844]|nr:hypothetical protein [Nostoc sp. CHAB 5844]